MPNLIHHFRFLTSSISPMTMITLDKARIRASPPNLLLAPADIDGQRHWELDLAPFEHQHSRCQDADRRQPDRYPTTERSRHAVPFVPSRTINKPQSRRDPTHQMAQTEAEHEGQDNQAERHLQEHGLVLRIHRPVDSQRIVFGVSPDSGRPGSARWYLRRRTRFPAPGTRR